MQNYKRNHHLKLILEYSKLRAQSPDLYKLTLDHPFEWAPQRTLHNQHSSNEISPPESIYANSSKFEHFCSENCLRRSQSSLSRFQGCTTACAYNNDIYWFYNLLFLNINIHLSLAYNQRSIDTEEDKTLSHCKHIASIQGQRDPCPNSDESRWKFDNQKIISFHTFFSSFCWPISMQDYPEPTSWEIRLSWGRTYVIFF